jgi:hypothetical protein
MEVASESSPHAAGTHGGAEISRSGSRYALGQQIPKDYVAGRRASMDAQLAA